MSNIVFFTGAGISVPSGIPPYRGKGGLYEDPNIENIVSYNTWCLHPEIVIDHVENMKEKVSSCQPNAAHYAIAELEKLHDVTVITQNIDDLHIKAGSTKVFELHGNIFRTRPETKTSTENGFITVEVTIDRPDVVLFGENLDQALWHKAWAATEAADVFISVGTSAQVWPARDLLDIANDRKYIEHVPFLFLSMDPPPQDLHFATFVEGSAEVTVPQVCEQIDVLLR